MANGSLWVVLRCKSKACMSMDDNAAQPHSTARHHHMQSLRLRTQTQATCADRGNRAGSPGNLPHLRQPLRSHQPAAAMACCCCHCLFCSRGCDWSVLCCALPARLALHLARAAAAHCQLGSAPAGQQDATLAGCCDCSGRRVGHCCAAGRAAALGWALHCVKGSWNGVAGSVVVRDLQVVVGLRCGLRANCPCFACALRAAEHFAPPRGCAAGVVCCWDSLQHHGGPRIDEHDQGGKGHKGKRKLLKAQGTCACPAALTTAASNIQSRTDHVKAATRRAGHGRSPLLACGLVESLSGDSCRLLDSLEVPEEVTLFRLLVCSSGEGLPVTTPRFLAPPLSGLIPLPLPLPLLLLRLLGLLGSVSGKSGARAVGFDSRPLSGCCRLLLAPDAGDSS